MGICWDFQNHSECRAILLRFLGNGSDWSEFANFSHCSYFYSFNLWLTTQTLNTANIYINTRRLHGTNEFKFLLYSDMKCYFELDKSI